MTSRLLLASPVAALLCLPVSLTAQTKTWDGGGLNNNISTALNWTDNIAPVSDLANTSLSFTGTVRPAPNFSTTFRANSIFFPLSAGAFTLGGSAITIGSGGIANLSSQTQRINNEVTLGASSSSFSAFSGRLEFLGGLGLGTNTLTLGGGQPITLGGGITGRGTIEKNSSSNLTIRASATPITATLNINDSNLFLDPTGTVQIVNAPGAINVSADAGFGSAENLSFTNGAQCHSAGSGTSVSDNKTLRIESGSDFIIDRSSHQLAGSGSFLVTGTGSTLQAISGRIETLSAALAVENGGSLTASGGLRIGDNGAAPLTVDGPGSSVSAGGLSTLGRFAGLTPLTFSNQAAGSFAGLQMGGGDGCIADGKVLSGADVINSGSLSVGNNTPATAISTLLIDGAGSTWHQSAGEVTVGGDQDEGPGTLTVRDGATFTTAAAFTVNGNGTVVLSGGTLSASGLFSNNGSFTFSSGALHLLGPNNLTAGTGGLLGTSPTLTATREVSIGGATTVDVFRTFTLNGGTLRTGTLVNNGTFSFNSGTLAITGAAGFQLDGSPGTGFLRNLDSGKTWQVTHTTTVAAGTNFTVDGGSFSTGAALFRGGVRVAAGDVNVENATTIASGGSLSLEDGSFSGSSLTNEGTLDHRGGTLLLTGTLNNTTGGRLFVGGLASSLGAIANAGRITLQGGAGFLGGTGALTNTGLISGDGTIAKPVSNNAGGHIRAGLGDHLHLFTLSAANAGTLLLDGGTLEITDPVTNAPGGFITGRGTLHSDALTNQGAMAFSGGVTDLHGDVTNATGGRIVTSGGGATTTFADDVVHNGLEIFTGAGCSTVFFGGQSGAGPFTGTGTVYYVGDLRPGNSPSTVTYGGDVVLGPFTGLTMELGGTARGTQHDSLSIAGTLSPAGSLTLALINGFVPASGHSFDLFDTGAIAGAFQSVQLPALASGLQWDASQLYTTGIIRVVPEALTFAAWAASTLGDPNATPDGDHDFDGWDNATEFVLGLHPPQPGTVLPDGGLFTYQDGQRLRLTFTRPLDRTGITLRVQASDDLVTWSDVAVSVDSGPFTGAGFVSENRNHPLNEPGIVEVRDIVPTTGSSRRQLRLRSEIDP